MPHRWATQGPTGSPVSYRRRRPGPPRPTEVEDPESLHRLLRSGAPLAGVRLQGLDLGPHADQLLARRDLHGLVVLGGQVPDAVELHLRRHGAVLFPTDPAAPVRPYRGTLYTADELYAGLTERGYAATPDARAYAWAEDADLRRDAYITLLRAIHDDAMTDALTALLSARSVVGVMGGHALARGTTGFAEAAGLGHRLAESGHVVATGGGPGAMEAANLGAWCTETQQLTDALGQLAAVPGFAEDTGAWASAAMEVRAARGPGERVPGQVRSVGIPTWHYGHEPPNVFVDRIAKFFSNALREDLLLHLSTAGVVVLPGAAGTVQEIFQTATRLYYEVEGRVPPLVLVDVEHWTEHLPVWPLLRSLGAGRAMQRRVQLVERPDQALEALAAATD